jgi:hypothetical protein
MPPKNPPHTKIQPTSTPTDLSSAVSPSAASASATQLAAGTRPYNENLFKTLPEAEAFASSRGLSLGGMVQKLETHDPGSFTFCTIEFPGISEGSLSFITSCLLHSEDKVLIEALHPFHDALLPVAELAIEVKPVPDHSDEHGLFASTTAIPTGSIIAVERPSVVFPVSMPLGSLDMEAIDVCRTLFGQLGGSSNQAKELRLLANSHPNVSCKEEGIMRTNGLGISITATSSHSGVFSKISRCNHR